MLTQHLITNLWFLKIFLKVNCVCFKYKLFLRRPSLSLYLRMYLTRLHYIIYKGSNAIIMDTLIKDDHGALPLPLKQKNSYADLILGEMYCQLQDFTIFQVFDKPRMYIRKDFRSQKIRNVTKGKFSLFNSPCLSGTMWPTLNSSPPKISSIGQTASLNIHSFSSVDVKKEVSANPNSESLCQRTNRWCLVP